MDNEKLNTDEENFVEFRSFTEVRNAFESSEIAAMSKYSGFDNSEMYMYILHCSDGSTTLRQLFAQYVVWKGYTLESFGLTRKDIPHLKINLIPYRDIIEKDKIKAMLKESSDDVYNALKKLAVVKPEDLHGHFTVIFFHEKVVQL